MTTTYDMWLYRDAIRETIEQGIGIIRSTSQSGSQLSPVNREDVTGAARFKLSGLYNGLNAADIRIELSNVGKDAASDLAILPIATEPKAFSGNTGNGACTVTVGNDCRRALDLRLTCKRLGTGDTQNAVAYSDDYDASVAAGDNPGIGLVIENYLDTGADGNAATVVIAKQTLGERYAWTTSTAHGISTGATMAVGDTQITFDADPTGLFDGDTIIYLDFDDGVVYACAVPSEISGVWKAYIWPRCRVEVANSTAIPKVASDAGYKITANSETYYATDQGASARRILNCLDYSDLMGVGATTGAGGEADNGDDIASCDYRVKDGSRVVDVFPLQVETMTFASGADAGDTVFEPTLLNGGVTPYENTIVVVGGGATTLGSGGVYEAIVTIAAGDESFAVGDYFDVLFRQLKTKLSVDGGTTYGSAVSATSTSSSIGAGLTLEINTIASMIEPFVQGDILAATASYRYSHSNLANPSRLNRWRSKTSDYTQAILCDSGSMNLGGTVIALCDHNVSSAGTITAFCIGDSNIHKFYGTVTGGSSSTINTGQTLGADEHDNGLFAICSGALMGRTYPITGNTTGGVYTVTGTPHADGLLTGDAYMIIPLTTFDDIRYYKTITTPNPTKHATTMFDNIYSGSWIVSFSDTSNDSGWIEVGMIRIGASYRPKNADLVYEPHSYIEREMSAFANLIEPFIEDKRFPRGLRQESFAVVYEETDRALIKPALETMVRYVNNRTRYIPVLFWESDTDLHSFWVAWTGAVMTQDVDALNSQITITLASIEAE